MGHRVNDVVDSEADGLRAVLERLVAVIEIFPEIADIVVVIRDQLEVAVLVRQSPEFRNKIPIWRIHFQRVDIEETMEDRMSKIDPDELPFRKRELQVMAQDLQFLGAMEVGRSPEIIRHDEAAPPYVLAEVLDLFVIERKEAGFGQVEKGILENFVA